MQTFQTTRRVRHSADEMFALVAAVEDYPKFVPLCEQLRVRGREETGDAQVLVADMTIAYKFLRETFASRVTIEPKERQILVEYLDGPFRHLENRWRFEAVADTICDIDFYIAYEFRSRSLQLLMGAMFDKAFRKFVLAFEERADVVYGRPQRPAEGLPAI
jgi:coenzyme Q-binding protein COQ10